MCCDSGRMISSGNGKRRDGIPDVRSLFSGGCTPFWKLGSPEDFVLNAIS